MTIINALKSFYHAQNLPKRLKNEIRQDHKGLPQRDHSLEQAVDAAMQWMARAQDCSLTHDGGVSRDFSFINGWASSYPETTGYIIPTFLKYAEGYHQDDFRERARKMLDWMVKIQLPGGGFQGGKVDSTPVVPVTFNTGQILIGLADGVRHFGDEYLPAMRDAADWLAQSLDEDGCWRKHPTPFAANGEKAYETHVSWGLFEAARVVPDAGYAEAGQKNVDWALTKQAANGWFADCCLDQPDAPLTHTLGYVLRGILEGYRLTKRDDYLAAAIKLADALLAQLKDDGYLAGRWYADWTPAVDWVCLTGSVQVAYCWFYLYELTGEARYFDAGVKANSYVRRTQKMEGDLDERGGIKGAFPVDGDYGIYQYLNWAPKFFADSHMKEIELRKAQG